MRAEARLKELGLELPTAPTPIANYVTAARSGNLLFLSGHGPLQGGRAVQPQRLLDPVRGERQ